MRSAPRTAILAWATVLVPAVSGVHADTFLLKDGTEVAGTVTYESDDVIHVDTSTGLVIIDLRDVRRRVVSPPTAEPLDPAKQERIDKAVYEYTRQLRAIKRTYLDRPRDSKYEGAFAKGRKRVLAMNDPLAIDPLTRLLSDGDERCRVLLVEALDRFDDDQATMNLVVVALLDPAESVRLKAAEALLKRNDPRVVSDLRSALQSDEDFVVRNAAVALGILRAREAAPDLIHLLSYERKVSYTVPREALLTTIQGNYIAGYRAKVARGVAQVEPIIGVIGSGSAISSAPITVRLTQTVYRTEVQEALIAITGQNFGFSHDKWLQWLAQNPPPKNP
ncbi:MAG: HEAT repeat domain-containing protein [Phycisphaerales bacterium]|nr:MAG: HEAT repeat domain-containing protein [Phycisphaerales bacterium]